MGYPDSRGLLREIFGLQLTDDPTRHTVPMAQTMGPFAGRSKPAL
jgi:hypothetical protein